MEEHEESQDIEAGQTKAPAPKVPKVKYTTNKNTEGEQAKLVQKRTIETVDGVNKKVDENKKDADTKNSELRHEVKENEKKRKRDYKVGLVGTGIAILGTIGMYAIYDHFNEQDDDDDTDEVCFDGGLEDQIDHGLNSLLMETGEHAHDLTVMEMQYDVLHEDYQDAHQNALNANATVKEIESDVNGLTNEVNIYVEKARPILNKDPSELTSEDIDDLNVYKQVLEDLKDGLEEQTPTILSDYSDAMQDGETAVKEMNYIENQINTMNEKLGEEDHASHVEKEVKHYQTQEGNLCEESESLNTKFADVGTAKEQYEQQLNKTKEKVGGFVDEDVSFEPDKDTLENTINGYKSAAQHAIDKIDEKIDAYEPTSPSAEEKTYNINEGEIGVFLETQNEIRDSGEYPDEFYINDGQQADWTDGDENNYELVGVEYKISDDSAAENATQIYKLRTPEGETTTIEHKVSKAYAQKMVNELYGKEGE
ncbi:hypothetical protein GF374_00840 [Candidatus Woesearchaeota archaeon]|nr:hypothetical protein [Candidatus Woesearchaeota archaeon]